MNDFESKFRIGTNAWASMMLRKSIERSKRRKDIVIIALESFETAFLRASAITANSANIELNHVPHLFWILITGILFGWVLIAGEKFTAQLIIYTYCIMCIAL